MGVDDDERLRFSFMKDAITAEYQTHTTRWQNLQTAALAVGALGLAGHVQGILGLPPLLALGAVVAVFLGTTWSVLAWYDRKYEEEISELLKQMRRLKRGERE